MFVAIHHNITDAQQWEEVIGKVGSIMEQGQLPKGMKGVYYLPSTDGRRADCLWEADSLEQVKSFLEPLTSPAARNDYFQINVEHAMGLPVQAQQHAAAH